MIGESPLDSLQQAKYLRLTTFRRDGTGVPTPVWAVRDGDTLLVTTTASTGKVKRIRHTPRVLLAPCDNRGRVTAGVVDVEGTAEVFDDPVSLGRLGRLLRERYGVLYTLLVWFGRRRQAERVGLRITSP